ncbi:MAG TPA: hypothetical protein VM285_09890, partial [Polyangia bacterium]|nr:hypothetical protein [Polyangia bacterium]
MPPRATPTRTAAPLLLAGAVCLACACRSPSPGPAAADGTIAAAQPASLVEGRDAGAHREPPSAVESVPSFGIPDGMLGVPGGEFVMGADDRGEG